MKKKSVLLLLAATAMLLSACGASQPSEEVKPISSKEPATTEQASSSSEKSQEPTSSAPTVKQYTITFNDENGNTLESKKWDEGSVPSYNYEKSDTAEWDYTVKGWATTLGGAPITIPAAAADATYYAVVEAVKQKYLVTFYSENGQQIKQDNLEYGAQPSCDYTGPSDTAEWDYTFAGWATSANGTALATLPKVSGIANYYAVVSSVKQKYDVKFFDENGTQLNSIKYSYGDTPSYTYNKQDTQEWDYTVLGWASTPTGDVLSSLPAVTGNASYYAKVNAVKQRYTITFLSRGGSTVNPITEDYGTSIPEPTKPTRDNYRFSGWSTDEAGNNGVSWPFTLTKNETFYANWNEKVDIKAYLASLMGALEMDPNSYLPDAMKPEYSANHVTNPSQVNYDFNNFTNVSSIKYGGFGEQWNMVLENMAESERFYSVLTLGETLINTSVALFNNYLDNNPSDTASHTLRETEYTAKLDFADNILSYTIQYKTGWTIPFFGEVLPQIDMKYNVTTQEKEVRIQLSENNAMKYTVRGDVYKFYLAYGVSTVSRKAYCELARYDDVTVEGHIYEFVQFKDKDLMPAVVDFYIGETYTTVVGNKAGGLVGFKGYINELYKTSEGKLLGYEVRETLTILGISGTYNTLWFNLNNIKNITSVKAVENDNNTGTYSNKNPHDIYLNGSSSKFEPTYNTKPLIGNTSRKYDVELRRQYFYGYNSSELVKYETSIPMMFIQADNDKDTNFTDFPADILSKSGIEASVTLATAYLQKIQSDYAYYIDVLIGHESSFDGDWISYQLGSAVVIE